MSKLIVVIMQQNEYPFGEYDNSHLQKKKVMVRKRVQFHPFQKKNMLLKAKKLKSFNNKYIIKLQQLLQQDSSLHLLFQYIPIKIQTWISNINAEFIENFRHQLMELAEYLAQNNILIDFKLRNIGMNQDYNPKYFIGMDYQINQHPGKDHLFQKYSTQISQILNPYKQHNLDDIKNKKSTEPNPQFYLQRKGSTLKRQNQKSFKNCFTTNQSVRTTSIAKHKISHRESVKKISNQFDMKLAFDGSQKQNFNNLPKNISTNIKIQNIGKKINDLRNLLQNISNKNAQRKHDSLSLSPFKNIAEERPNSSYQKGIKSTKQQNNNKKSQKIQKVVHKHYGFNKINHNELRETQSQSQYSVSGPNWKGLDKTNEKKSIEPNQTKLKNQVKVGGTKRSYIFQFQRLLDDDIDILSVGEDKGQPLGINKPEQKSPCFGFSSGGIQIESYKTQPQRFSYSHNTRKRKNSSQSASSKGSNMQERVNAVIGASKKLINNFRKSKQNQEKIIANSVNL